MSDMPCDSMIFQRRWFAYEGCTYCVINPSSEESLPGIATDDPERNLTCRDMRKALWAMDKAPEMAYMLKKYSSESAFLARLNCDSESLRIVKAKTQHTALTPI